MKTITLTSKGQLTLPAEVQRLLGLKPSDKLHVTVDPETRSVTLQKPMTINEFTTFMDTIPRKKVPPLTDVDTYYQEHRRVAK